MTSNTPLSPLNCIVFFTLLKKGPGPLYSRFVPSSQVQAQTVYLTGNTFYNTFQHFKIHYLESFKVSEALNCLGGMPAVYTASLMDGSANCFNPNLNTTGWFRHMNEVPYNTLFILTPVCSFLGNRHDKTPK